MPTGAGAASPARHVDVIEVSGLLDPILVDFTGDALRRAQTGHAAALVIQLNSQGSVAPPASVRRLAARLAASKVPVAIWVGPGNARVKGVALELARAADLVAVSPGSHVDGNIGQPIEKSPTIGDFIAIKLDPIANTSEVRREGGRDHLVLVVQARFAKPGLVPRLLHAVTSPTVAYLLLVVGLLLLAFEYFTAGIGIAGVVGAVCLVLSAYGLAVLPTRPVGLALIGVGMLGYCIDLQAGAPRVWTGIGTVALAVGSLNLYRGQSPGLLPMVVAVVGSFLLMVPGMAAMLRSRFATPTIGRQSMIGEPGTAKAALDPTGLVEVRGALWQARTNRATPIAMGAAVRVVAVEGLELEVEPVA